MSPDSSTVAAGNDGFSMETAGGIDTIQFWSVYFVDKLKVYVS